MQKIENTNLPERTKKNNKTKKRQKKTKKNFNF